MVVGASRMDVRVRLGASAPRLAPVRSWRWRLQPQTRLVTLQTPSAGGLLCRGRTAAGPPLSPGAVLESRRRGSTIATAALSFSPSVPEHWKQQMKAVGNQRVLQRCGGGVEWLDSAHHLVTGDRGGYDSGPLHTPN